MIDLLVYRETCVRGRRVWLDYRQNPGGGKVDFQALSREAREYLEKAGACQEMPYERLCQLNGPAAAFYSQHGTDLSGEMLEVAVCAQHNNGGLSVNEWWQTNVEGLFAVGEAAGTHGIYRPGGSALNAGQAGSTRAAQYIGAHKDGKRPWDRETEERLMAKVWQWIAGLRLGTEERGRGRKGADSGGEGREGGNREGRNRKGRNRKAGDSRGRDSRDGICRRKSWQPVEAGGRKDEQIWSHAP